MADYLTFENIYQAVMLAIGDSSYARTTEVKAVINQVYLNEVLQCDELYPLFWLLSCDDSKKAKARATITGISKAAAGVVTAAAHGLVSGDIVTLYGIEGMTELNNRTLVVVYVGTSSFTLTDLDGTAIATTSYTTYSSGGYAHHRGVTLTDCHEVLHTNWYGYDNGMGFITPEQVEAQASLMDENRSRPTRCMHRQVMSASGGQVDYLLWYQAADAAYDLRAWYVKQPARLSATSDVPLIPHQFHDCLIAGTIARLGENKVQVEAGVVWPDLYVRQLDAIKAYNRKWWEKNKAFERSGLFLA